MQLCCPAPLPLEGSGLLPRALQRDFIQPPASTGSPCVRVSCVCQCVRVSCVCSLDWLRPPSCTRLIDALRGRETGRERVSHLAYAFHCPQGLRHSLRWTHFRSLMKALQTSCNYRCARLPRSSGKVKRTNKVLTLKLSELAKATGLSRVAPGLSDCLRRPLRETDSLYLRQTLGCWYTAFCWCLGSRRATVRR